MSSHRQSGSGFILGLLLGAIAGAVLAIVIYKNRRSEVIRTLETKIKNFLNELIGDYNFASPKSHKSKSKKRLIAKSIPLTTSPVLVSGSKIPVELPKSVLAAAAPANPVKSPHRPRLFKKPR